MADPTYLAAGTPVAAAPGPVSCVPPAHVLHDALLFIVGQKEGGASGPIICNTVDSRLVKLGEKLTSFGVAGADTGPTRLAAFWRVADGTELSSYAFTGGGSDVIYAQALRIGTTSGLGDLGLWSAALATGEDVVADTTWSATVDTIDLAPKDVLVAASLIPTDVTTPAQFTVEEVTAPGFTFGAMTEIAEWDTATGNDLGGFLFTQVVATGAGSTTPTVTATASGTVTNVYGPTLLVRLRQLQFPNPERWATSRYPENIAAYSTTITVVRQSAGWGYVLDPGVGVLPPSPDASSRLHVNVT